MNDVDPAAATALGLGADTVLLGQYRLERQLGAGGMGEVWLARDQQLDRLVAAKVLPSVLMSSARAAEALRSEAARAIELSHRSIGRVYHFALHEDSPVLVMEYIEGESLAEYLDTHRELEPGRVVELLAPLADALDYAHEQKVVHRDLKPANIMLRADGSPVLMDFGLAAEARDQSSILGKTGEMEISGTLAYMSPEQIKGKRPRKSMDLYSLAATAYEMLEGNPPFFRGDTAAIYQQIIHEPIEPIERWGSSLDRVLSRALAKAPQDRFASAQAFVAALAEAAEAGPDEAAPSPAQAATVVDAPPPSGAATVVAAAPIVSAETVAVGRREAIAGAETVVGEEAPAPAPAPVHPVDPLEDEDVAFLEADPDPGPPPEDLRSPRAATPGPRRSSWIPGLLVVVATLGALHYLGFLFPSPRWSVGEVWFRRDGSRQGPATAFLLRVREKTWAVTSYGAFAPPAADAPSSPSELAPVVRTASFRFGGRGLSSATHVTLPGVEATTATYEDKLDLAVFELPDQPSGGLELAASPPWGGAEGRVLAHDGTSYPVRFSPSNGAALTYDFTQGAPPRSALGAPVLDAEDLVVGVHTLTSRLPRQPLGVCTRAARIREALE